MSKFDTVSVTRLAEILPNDARRAAVLAELVDEVLGYPKHPSIQHVKDLLALGPARLAELFPKVGFKTFAWAIDRLGGTKNFSGKA